MIPLITQLSTLVFGHIRRKKPAKLVMKKQSIKKAKSPLIGDTNGSEDSDDIYSDDTEEDYFNPSIFIVSKAIGDK